MKYVILVGDGMGDYPIAQLGNKTPLMAAPTPNMDSLAARGRLGLAQSIPPDRHPGSDTANMALMGINPSNYMCGRGPMEAASMGIELADNDIAFRCNLVQLGFQPDGTIIMDDYAAGHITTVESHELINFLQQKLGTQTHTFYPGVSFRHVMVWQNGPFAAPAVPPHDRSGQPVNDALEGPLASIAEITRSTWPLLKDHPVNLKRAAQGMAIANSIWLWGQSKRPNFPTLKSRFGLSGVVITAVDLVKGLGKMVGLDIIDVPGATGYLDTNYAGKVQATLDSLASHDFAFIHVEAPDEASHEGKLDLKMKAIADFDALVVGPLLAGLQKFGKHRVLLATDHFTPIVTRTHARDPIPYALWQSDESKQQARGYNEADATAFGGNIIPAYTLIDELLQK